MSGFESRLEDDKTTKRRQKSFQSVPVNDYKPEKIHNFLILKEAWKAENTNILVVAWHFRHEISNIWNKFIWIFAQKSNSNFGQNHQNSFVVKKFDFFSWFSNFVLFELKAIWHQVSGESLVAWAPLIFSDTARPLSSRPGPSCFTIFQEHHLFHLRKACTSPVTFFKERDFHEKKNFRNSN